MRRRGGLIAALGACFLSCTGLVSNARAELISYHAGDVFVAGTDETGAGQVVQFDPVSGDQHVVAHAGLLKDPVDVAFASDGAMIVADRKAVVRIDPTNGAQSYLAKPGLISGISGLAVRDNGNIFVASITQHAILQLQPSGAPSLFSDFGEFATPARLNFDLNGNLLAVIDQGLDDGGWVRLDANTGTMKMSSGGAIYFNPVAAAGAPFDVVVVARQSNDPQVVVDTGGIDTIPVFNSHLVDLAAELDGTFIALAGPDSQMFRIDIHEKTAELIYSGVGEAGGLTVAPADGSINAIPLPAGVWTGAGGLATVVALRQWIASRRH